MLIRDLNCLKGLPAYIYCRVSVGREDEEEKTTLPFQEEICMEVVEKYGLDLKKIYVETGSAMRMHQRPKFMEMLKEVKSQKGKKIIIVYDLSRLSRNLGDAGEIEDLMIFDDLTLICSSNEDIYLAPVDEGRNLLFTIQIACARQTALLSNKKCRAGIREKSEKGFRSCKPPLGYQNDKDSRTARVVEKEAEMVRTIFDLADKEKLSYDEIRDRLFEMGFAYKHETGKIPRSTLESILQNQFYAGIYSVKQTGEFVQGNHKAIISKAQFDRVRKFYQQFATGERKNDLLYSKLITCPHCGKFLVGDVKTKTNGKVYVYWSCKNKDCTEKPSTNETKIEEKIHSYLKELRLSLIPKELCKKIFDECLAEKKQKLNTLKRARTSKNKKELETQELIAEGRCDEKSAMIRRAKNEEKYGDIDNQIEVLSRQLQEIESSFEKAMQDSLWDFYMRLSKETKRQILELICNSCKWTENGLKITFKSAFRDIRSRYAPKAS